VVRRGVNFSSRVRLILWAILDSIPRTIRRRLPLGAARRFEQIEKKLLSRSIVKFGGHLYYLVDAESTYIISDAFEEWMWGWLKIDGGGVFVDVGAHVGRYTIPLAKAVGDGGLVIAVEPHPENYEILVRNIELNGLKNVVAVNKAAYSRVCKLKLYTALRHGQHSVVKDHGLGYVIVDAEPVDDILNRLGVEKVSCVKIDVEGAELEVLKGMRRTLEKHRPRVIVEVAGDPAEVERLAAESKYSVRLISPEGSYPPYYLLEPESP